MDTDACTNLCEPAACGDSIVWAGEEECDDGADNGPCKACNANCKASTCGDGDIGPGETCDDGNESASCNADCTVAACGDGVLNTTAGETCDDGGESAQCDLDCTAAECPDGVTNSAAGEACDDGNMADTDACLNTCLKPRRVIFVTSAKFEGDLMGMSGADIKCQTAAMDAGLANASTFKAWLSDGATWPAKRFDTLYAGMYVLTDGTPVVENGFADLTDGELLHAVSLTELKSKVSSGPWTNVNTAGTNVGLNRCNAWTNLEVNYFGGVGNSTATDATWTDAVSNVPCSAPAPLYCIEDP